MDIVRFRLYGNLPTMQLAGDPNQRVEDTTDPADKSFDDRGVDRTLILWMLSLSPQERLQVLENSIGSIQQLRRGRKDS